MRKISKMGEIESFHKILLDFKKATTTSSTFAQYVDF